jgi:hypothetical protein
MPEEEKYDVLEKIGTHRRVADGATRILTLYRPWVLWYHSQGQAQVGRICMSPRQSLRTRLANRPVDPLPQGNQLS